MALIRHQIGPDAASTGLTPRQPATIFADAAALTAYEEETATPDTDADRIVGAILQLAPRLHAARAESGAADLPASERSLRGLRLGIVGASTTHCALAERLRTAFGMAISCTADGTAGHGYHLVEDTETLLSIADVVVAVEATGADFWLDSKALNAMRPHGTIIVNPAAVAVDQMALAYALWFETIAAAGVLRSVVPRLLPEVENAHNVMLV
ncbi:NAD(P)-dependent oxidoreductase [Dichotomicrobium thermohalophilum]|uniref:D-isomer specific 2-hydroxyacid dehydrogenase-like protein n=1 Tax=Dichotomicrobium thermohalophilum TaxID=933063 RepID=A0A397Q644_9HYPH|nr:NAD(P)-dependent oxidoreductase [Dichotomicrobium thermohalophilum]RIA55007.1 D-isomer specific 2-hydroxyacid dehydrogenase-like protein [Dichotomicrobium thermohalophilum]